MRNPWASPLAVAMPTRKPANAPARCRPRSRSAASGGCSARRGSGRSRAAASRRGDSRPATSRSPSATPAGDPVAITTWVVAVSMARMAGRRPSWVIGARLEIGPIALAPGDQGDRARLVAGPVDAHVEPVGRKRVAQPLRPLDERDPGRLPFVDEAARERVLGARQPVRVDVEQRQPALVLGHQDEARRGDRVGHAETGPERLGEVCLARAELAPQTDEVAGSRHAAERVGRAGSWRRGRGRRR